MHSSPQARRSLISVAVVDESVEPPQESRLHLDPSQVEAVWQVQFHNRQEELSPAAWQLLVEHGETLYELALQQMEIAKASTQH